MKKISWPIWHFVRIKKKQSTKYKNFASHAEHNRKQQKATEVSRGRQKVMNTPGHTFVAMWLLKILKSAICESLWANVIFSLVLTFWLHDSDVTADIC